MAYASVIQFVALVGEAEARVLATPAAPATGYDAAKIEGALASASGTLDTYFATRYATPLSPVPQVVADAALDLARELLDRNSRDFVIKAADRRRAWAKDVSMGKATLGVTSGSAADPGAASSAAGAVLISAPDRVFDDAGLASFLGGC
jgi:phage gp36-like protein